MKAENWILSTVVAAALAGFLPQSKAALSLGSAESFGVLGASTVTSTGNTVVNGDLGLYPGTSITGFGPGIVNGVIHQTDVAAQNAQADALTAYNSLAGETPTATLTGQNLGGLTLTPGVYFFSTSADLTGTLTLNGNGGYVFLIGNTLTTAAGISTTDPGSSVVLTGGAQPCQVFWQVGGSATIGTYSDFVGNILASASITANTGATVEGRLLALNGAVTLDDNLITVPTCVVPEASSLWSGAVCIAICAWQWLAVWRRKGERSRAASQGSLGMASAP
ncbi:MAG: ice-binding family protein [Verrucomicrobia bacterium]|nr:ice-binding family protein [Verrucomicrobiota bacterium]